MTCYLWVLIPMFVFALADVVMTAWRLYQQGKNNE